MSTARTAQPALTHLDLGPLKPLHRGKVREMFDLGEHFLMVATDRISAYDCILPTGIPDKGKVLTALSVTWFDALRDVVPHHYVSGRVEDFPAEFQPHAAVLDGRSLLVKKADRVDVECVVRGYLAGSGWKEYRRDGTVCGLRLPEGLQESDKLPEPIFTPATKEDDGHDQNIPFETMENLVGAETSAELRDLSISIYKNVAAYCAGRGIIVADTKFEFGRIEGRLSLIDEVLTPDSSRFWPMDKYQPGKSQESFDKQFVRDYLETLDWNKEPPAPELPGNIVKATTERYLEAKLRLVEPGLRFTPENWQ